MLRGEWPLKQLFAVQLNDVFQIGIACFLLHSFITTKFKFILLLGPIYCCESRILVLPFGVNSIWSQFKFISRTRRKVYMQQYLSIISKLKPICIYRKSTRK